MNFFLVYLVGIIYYYIMYKVDSSFFSLLLVFLVDGKIFFKFFFYFKIYLIGIDRFYIY